MEQAQNLNLLLFPFCSVHTKLANLLQNSDLVPAKNVRGVTWKALMLFEFCHIHKTNAENWQHQLFTILEKLIASFVALAQHFLWNDDVDRLLCFVPLCQSLLSHCCHGNEFQLAWKLVRAH